MKLAYLGKEARQGGKGGALLRRAAAALGAGKLEGGWEALVLKSYAMIIESYC